jgi:hypothetical protein
MSFKVISNLKQSLVLPHRLQLSIGDSVCILEECGQWYYGYSLKNRNRLGIFPKNYISLKDAVVDKTGYQLISCLSFASIDFNLKLFTKIKSSRSCYSSRTAYYSRNNISYTRMGCHLETALCRGFSLRFN